MKKRLYVGNTVEGYVTDEVSIIPTMFANLSQATREKFVTDLAAVSRGKDESKNPEARFKALLKEAAPNSTGDIIEGSNGNFSRPGEFCPAICDFAKVTDHMGNDSWVLIDFEQNEENFDKDTHLYYFKDVMFTDTDFINKICRYSYVQPYKEGVNLLTLYTNLRALVNAGVPYEAIPFMQEFRYIQYGVDKDDLYIIIDDKKTSVYDISIKYSVSQFDFKTVLTFKVKDLLASGYTEGAIISDFYRGHCYVDNRYSDFKAIKLKIPMMCWQQWPMTHTALSKESQSDRVSEGNGYWLPEGIIDRINNAKQEDIDKIKYSQEFIDLQTITSSDLPTANKIEYILNTFLHVVPQECVQQILKAAGYKREIWSRAPYYFKYKECVVTGWYNDPTTWQHSFLERSAKTHMWKNWTQKETREVMEAVLEIIERK